MKTASTTELEVIANMAPELVAITRDASGSPVRIEVIWKTHWLNGVWIPVSGRWERVD